MAKRKRMAWIVAGLLVGVLAVGGGWWYYFNNSGAKLLSRARVALNAGKFQKAEELAKKYVGQAPGDWHGHYTLAVAYQRQGKQEQARTALTEASRINPRRVDIALAMAKTYWHSDAAVVARPDLASDPNELQAAIAGLVKADDVMAKFAPDPNDQAGWLELQGARGLGLAKLARVQFALAGKLAAPAKVADAARQSILDLVSKGQAQAMRIQAEDTRKRAIEVLLGVVRKDPAQAAAAEVLLGLCIEGKDHDSLELARGAIESAGKPSATAALMLVEYDMKSAGVTTGAGRQAQLAQIVDRVQAIVDAHPTNAAAKCTRAELALMAGDWAMAERLSTEVMKSEAQNPRAILIHARSLLKAGRGDKADANQAHAARAEKELFSLKVNFGAWPQAQYWYARAAEAVGKTEAARTAMRAVTNLGTGAAQQEAETGILRAAHQYLADSLINDSPAQAFEEAAACYESDPNDPAMLGLYVRVAFASGQGVLAHQALVQAWKKRPSDLLVLDVVRNGLHALGDDANATRVAEQAASIPRANVTNIAQVLSVANSLTFLGRGAEADRLVSQAAEKDPNDPRAQLALASRYASSGRHYQAIELCRRAVALDPNTPDYRLALVGALINTRELDEARAVLEPILATSNEARDLDVQVRILQGKSIGDEDVLGGGGRSRSDLGLAYACVTGGQVERGIGICQAELERNPAAAIGWHLLLGQAYRARGKPDDCIRAWSAGITAYPQSERLYTEIALLLGGRIEPQEVAKHLSAIAGAKQILTDWAVAALYASKGQFAAAASLYAKVAADASASDAIRCQASVELARALASDNKPTEALAELDKLIRAGVQPRKTALTKARLLADLGRPGEAETLLADQLKLAETDRDAKAALNIADSLARLGKFDKALAACDMVQRIVPNEPESYVLRAGIFQQTGRGAETIDLYRKAITLQRTQLSYYVALAEALDAQNEPQQALDVLRQMEGLGRSGRLASLLRQGAMLARWGLKSEAARCLDPLMEYARTAPDQLVLASRFMAAGRKDKARLLLAKVPASAPEHFSAQVMLADLAETPQDKLAFLGAVDAERANGDAVLSRKMTAFMDANRPLDALKAFAQAAGLNKQPLPLSANLALAAALKQGDLSRAREVAVMLANVSREPSWRVVVDEINIELAPDQVARQLPEPQNATPVQVAMGLCLARQAGDDQALKRWADRLDQFANSEPATRSSSQAASQPAPRMSAKLLLLCSLLANNQQGIQAAAAAAGPVAAEAVRELCQSTGPGAVNKETARQLSDLLKAELALNVARPEFASFWAGRALEARPRCQWAALQTQYASGLAGLFGAPLPPERLKRAAELLEPRDCRLARELQADACMQAGQFDQALKLYAALADSDKGNWTWARLHAAALEKAGNPEDAVQHAENIKKALGLYRQAYLATKSTSACNNWAFLVCEVYPQDKAMLDEAFKAMDDLARKQASQFSFHDTAGWIAYRQGRTPDACRLLRQAVKHLPESAEVHYHLGLAESAANNKPLSRMHLERAIAIGQELREARRKDPATIIIPAEVQAADKARAAKIQLFTDQ